jgi:formate-dependent phosphoribosylglycinamide formyltransferase (GAR transformylase)
LAVDEYVESPAEFVADTEAEVKMLVEAWVRSQMYDVMGRIGIRS